MKYNWSSAKTNDKDESSWKVFSLPQLIIRKSQEASVFPDIRLKDCYPCQDPPSCGHTMSMEKQMYWPMLDVLAETRILLTQLSFIFFTIWYISHLTHASGHLHCLLYINMFKLCMRTFEATHSETFPLINVLNCTQCRPFPHNSTKHNFHVIHYHVISINYFHSTPRSLGMSHACVVINLLLKLYNMSKKMEAQQIKSTINHFTKD